MLRSCPRPPPDLHPVKSLELTSGLLTSLLLCLSSYLPRTREAPYLTSPPCTSPTTAHRLDAGGDRPSPLRGGNSPSSVTHTMTHLGISGGPGPGYDVPGLHSPLSRPSLQSCLSNPNLQASLSGPYPQLQGSPITPPDRLPPAWPSTHRPHLPGSPLTQFPARSTSSLLHLWFCPPQHPPTPPLPYSASAPGPSPATTVCRPVPVVCRPSQCQKVPTAAAQTVSPTSPTLSSITQGVPLDTRKLHTSQRRPPYPLEPPQFGSAHPATHPKASAAARAALSGLLSAALRVPAPGHAAAV